MHTVKITGVSDEVLKRLDERVAASGAASRSEFLRRLLSEERPWPVERLDLTRLFDRARLGRASLDAESLRREALYGPDDE
ncbi:MAG: ribbon-helix-helix protein, CopG family [Fimbriimonadaceae bacterium]|nr:ribbon-helix-helix protein, CopG family [Fimbriimonadaceae bacterium]